MRAAIYARYSSENQRPESIEDQVAACRRLAVQRGFTILEEHIYTDHAQSGARKDRPGLATLLTAGQQRAFEIVLVDDLSRLARGNYLMLSVLAELHFAGVHVVSVADGLDSHDEDATLGIQIRGIFNELQLQDLKKKTLRGQIGQKQRGFSVGEHTYGYTSVPVGATRLDKKGRPRPEGFKFEVLPGEAAVVLRVFQAYARGLSVIRIVRMLNIEAVPGRMRTSKGWSPATVSRLLDNEKYIGRWVWNKHEARRDPRTGRRRQFPKPASEWITHEDPSLRIVPQDLWEAVRLRRQQVRRTWPGGKGHRGFSANQGGRELHFPTHLLSGAMICGTCGATMAEVSGKAGGYYGCIAATKGACENKLLVRRTLVEKIILDTLRARLSFPGAIDYTLRRVEEEIGKLYAHIPETLRLKETELHAEQRRLANFVGFIGEGRGSRTLAQALLDTERKVDALKEELQGLRRSRDKVFQAPPREWVEERLTQLQDVLERNPDRSGLILRNFLGPLRLDPTRGDIGRPYYTARTSLNTLALLDPLTEDEVREASCILARRGERAGRTSGIRKAFPAGQHGAEDGEEPLGCLDSNIAMSPGRTRLGKLGRAKRGPGSQIRNAGPGDRSYTAVVGSTRTTGGMSVAGHSLGIDLSINSTHDCTVLDPTGQVAQRFTFDSSYAGMVQLDKQLRSVEVSHSAPVVVMEPTGLAWFLPCLYLRAQHPDVKVVRVKTSKVAALRRYLKQDAKSDRLDSLTLAKMPLVDPEKLYAVDLPPAAVQGLDRMTRQRARLVVSLTGRKNRLQALVGGYLPGLMAVVGKPWEPVFRAMLTVSLNPFTLVGQGNTELRKTLQDKRSREALPEAHFPRLRTACEQLTRLYRPIIEAGLLTESFFDDVQDEVARELRLMDVEEQEVKELEAAIARRYQEIVPEDHLRTIKGLGAITAPTILAAVGTPQRFHSQAAFRGWTGVVAHASQSADSDAKGLPMTKAGPRRVKLALYQAAEIARQWDPQLAKIYYDQMVHKGKPHYKAIGAVMSHLASRIHAVLTEQRDYVLRNVDGREVTAREARTIIQTRYRVPAAIRAERRISKRRKPDVSTDAHRGSAKRSSRRSSTSSHLHFTRS